MPEKLLETFHLNETF